MFVDQTSTCIYKLMRDHQTGKYTTGIKVHLRPHSSIPIKEKLILKQLKNLIYPTWNPYNFPVVQIGVSNCIYLSIFKIR